MLFLKGFVLVDPSITPPCRVGGRRHPTVAVHTKLSEEATRDRGPRFTRNRYSLDTRVTGCTWAGPKRATPAHKKDFTSWNTIPYEKLRASSRCVNAHITWTVASVLTKGVPSRTFSWHRIS